MKLCELPTKIIGVQVGELSLDLIRMGVPALKVRVALCTDDGPVGFVDLADPSRWSKKTLDAMRAFTEALEEDALQVIFRTPVQDAETAQAPSPSDPPQF